MGAKLTVIGAMLAMLVTAVAARSGHESASPSPAQPSTAVAESGYAKLLTALDQRIDGLQARANARDDDWLTRMHLGSALLERAGLTNDVGDFERVQTVLDEAFAIAPAGSGPLMLAARFNVSIHRLDLAEDYLERVDRQAMRRRDELVAAQVLRGQIAMQRGQYDVALAKLGEVAEVVPAAGTAELALYRAKTGAPDEADALLEQALASTPPADSRRRAWTLMQRGLIAMDRGMYLQALERLQEADAELSGWWLVQEHLAEAYDHLGQHGRALEIYEELVRVHGLPQHLDALAKARQHAGQDASDLVAAADAKWAELFARMPSAAIGHGLEHEIAFGSPARAVELAEANHAARPSGDAKVALARAYLAAGRPADALAIVDAALLTPYRTAGLHRVAADAHTALGETSAAAQQLALCVAINPSCESQTHSH